MACRVRASEEEVVWVRQELDEEFRELGRKTGRVGLHSELLAIEEVLRVRLRVRVLQQVRCDRAAIVLRETLADVVTRGRSFDW
jgi:hypothetical protein